MTQRNRGWSQLPCPGPIQACRDRCRRAGHPRSRCRYPDPARRNRYLPELHPGRSPRLPHRHRIAARSIPSERECRHLLRLSPSRPPRCPRLSHRRRRPRDRLRLPRWGTTGGDCRRQRAPPTRGPGQPTRHPSGPCRSSRRWPARRACHRPCPARAGCQHRATRNEDRRPPPPRARPPCRRRGPTGASRCLRQRRGAGRRSASRCA